MVHIPSEDGKESVEDLALFSERMSLSRKLLGKIARHSQVYRCILH